MTDSNLGEMSDSYMIDNHYKINKVNYTNSQILKKLNLNLKLNIKKKEESKNLQ